ncbi:MAG: hypothetical protein LQ350_001311 [Teloschistes chrysophthalmus]|nr:MAG: hypothetical protein LQ350_001311 [Niorma chrysophthalma]
MSLGKLTASIFSGAQELTVALAAFNFNFTLYKIEAPEEFKGLGNALTSYRRELAEDGEIHTTVRTLRAMFEPMLPSAPSLYTAYGFRASEIAVKLSRESKTKHGPGPFAMYQGIDGGSIWAAATSGDGAVSIHLLACMLAKLWPATEATSIWEEMVMRRTEQLSAADGKDARSVLAACAARSGLTRQQLANWDASARAWLRAGDEVVHVKQARLELVIGEIDKPVSTEKNVYENVLDAWTRAMVVLNELIKGNPHSITDGAVLVAMSAWHLFPDMWVPSITNQIVKQNDHLVDPDGILTLGLEPAQSRQSEESPSERLGTQTESRGVTWSLPLACHHFYGDPIRMQKAMNTDGSRITINQLLQLAMGSVFHGWRESDFNAGKAAAILSDLWNHCTDTSIATTQENDLPLPSGDSWFGLLAKTAQKYLTSEAVARVECRKYFNIGRKICPEFLGIDGESVSPIVALQRPTGFIKMAVDLEGQLCLLRKIAITRGYDTRDLVLFYMVPATQDEANTFVIATISPYNGIPEVSTFDKRWISTASDHRTSDDVLREVADVDIRTEIINEAKISGGWTTGSGRLLWSNAPADYSERNLVTGSVNEIFGNCTESVLPRAESVQDRHKVITGVPFECVLGDPAGAAVYCIQGTQRPLDPALSSDAIRATIGADTMTIS